MVVSHRKRIGSINHLFGGRQARHIGIGTHGRRLDLGQIKIQEPVGELWGQVNIANLPICRDHYE